MREKYKRRFFWRRMICALLIAVLAFSADWIPCAQNDAYAASDGMIRVYLTRLGSPSSIHLTPQCDYVLMVDDGYAVPAGTAVYVQAAGGSLTVTCGDWQVACGSSVRLTRTQGGNRGVRFTSPSLANLFSGDLTFYASGNAINTVLSIYIEDYLCGVVAYEMSDSYPLEALKAQAVAARNYALRQKSARGSSYYDVTDNTSNQVFKGYNASYGNVINAVRGTAGLTLYAGSALASCYYTASNGGQTESTKNAWGNALSYSVVKDDPYDLQSAGKKKTAAIRRDASGLHEKLAAALRVGTAPALNAAGLAGAQIEIQSINAITPHDPKYASPSRLYRTLTFNITVSAQASGKSAQLTCDVDIPTYGAFESWYDLSINSGSNETIAVEAGADAFTVTFRRWGHGIGMSQRGAQVMARENGAYGGQILEFSYPGTTRR
ncbi:MAG: SpoIID/LytB domain-containing protein, partial [Clostridia bacterium]|nr:SpoIID/LytB domain-containing protein [Clostridia bacterium]